MNIIRKAISAALILCLCACSGRTELSVPDYVWYMEQEDHDLVRKVTAGGYQYTIQLATPEYMACKQEPGGKAEMIARINQLNGHTFFIIKMSITEEHRIQAGGQLDAQRVTEADGMVAYYDQQAAGDISLKAGSETLQPATYNFEHNYGLAPHNTIVVAFKTGAAPQDMELVFNDRFRNNPRIQAGYSQLELSGLPTLKM